MPKQQGPVYTVQSDIEYKQYRGRTIILHNKGEKIPLAEAQRLHEQGLIDSKPTADADTDASTSGSRAARPSGRTDTKE